MDRRRFLKSSVLAGASTMLGPRFLSAQAPPGGISDEEILRRIDAHRPSRMGKLPPGLRDRVGATHTAGKYCLTEKPFLIEGAEKLLDLGTRVGKFWFMPENPQRSFPFHSRWGEYATLTDLAKSDDFARVFEMPFTTIFLEAHGRAEEGWARADRTESYDEGIEKEFYELTAHLYRTQNDRGRTVILQHWEGDWMLRGKAGDPWEKVPADAKLRCGRMVRWLAARQRGVARARADAPAGAKCRVLHAAEVNRVADAWKGIPTVTRDVLPHVELDLVSYSCYDGMSDPVLLWRCLEEIRANARTGPALGPRAVCVGEVGIPENDRPEGIAEKWDALFGVFLALDLPWVVQWELYCNEWKRSVDPVPPTPVKEPDLLRGFWLVKPDGSLSESGRFFQKLWTT